MFSQTAMAMAWETTVIAVMVLYFRQKIVAPRTQTAVQTMLAFWVPGVPFYRSLSAAWDVVQNRSTETRTGLVIVVTIVRLTRKEILGKAIQTKPIPTWMVSGMLATTVPVYRMRHT
jgi:hypothetical protein